MKVIVLAGGEGTRTEKIYPGVPKALIPVKGKPMIEHTIALYKDFEILLNVRAKDADKFKYLNLPLLLEKEPLGNAGAIKYFAKELGDKFIATHNDVLTDLDPKKLIEAHNGYGTMVVKDNSESKSFGIITNEGSLITGFTRKRLINCGIYCYSKDAIKYIGDGFQDVDRDLFPKLIKDKQLYLYEHKGNWEDVGSEAYLAKQPK